MRLFDSRENVFFVIEDTLLCPIFLKVCPFEGLFTLSSKVEKRYSRKIFKHLFTFSLLIV